MDRENIISHALIQKGKCQSLRKSVLLSNFLHHIVIEDPIMLVNSEKVTSNAESFPRESHKRGRDEEHESSHSHKKLHIEISTFSLENYLTHQITSEDSLDSSIFSLDEFVFETVLQNIICKLEKLCLGSSNSMRKSMQKKNYNICDGLLFTSLNN